MFNNLIESSSHRKEFKRRGSFLLFTTVTYALVILITGVVSIYAYDAHLDAQTTELEFLTFVPPQDTKAPPAETPRNTIHSTNNDGGPSRSVRTVLIDSVMNPNNAPRTVAVTSPGVPPARVDSQIGKFNADPVGPTNVSSGATGEGGPAVSVNVADPPPAPVVAAAKPAVPKILKISKVLNSQALFLPKPTYSSLARQIKVQGTVAVQVVIDEHGNVISAKAVSGHPLLVVEAQKAAMQARFSPTVVGDTPVKISGLITYNFVMQ